MTTEQHLHSDLAVPPGEYLEEVLFELGMTKDELARRMNRPAPKLSAIFRGEKTITPDTALQLERVVGVPAHIWTGLESEYRLTLARIRQEEEQARLKDETRLVTKYRYADLVKLGAIPKHTRAVDKVLELQKFFGVTSLKAIPGLKRYQLAFRRGPKKLKGQTPEAIAAWLRIGEVQALSCPCKPFSAKTLRNVLADIRKMTIQPPEKFQQALHELLNGAGVVLVLCRHMPGTGVQGATFWMGPSRAVVMMMLRYKWADIFWFSLFHELGHLLLHGRNTVVLEGIRTDDPKLKAQEDQANKFAAEILIPPSSYIVFLETGQFYDENIRLFADRISIDPGIVVGRLQNDGSLKREWQNGLRSQYNFEASIL